jgi:hypothetical protein
MNENLKQAIDTIKNAKPHDKPVKPDINKTPTTRKRRPTPKNPNPKRGNNTYPHGNHNRYFSDKCRCPLCTKAATEYSKTKRYQRYLTPHELIPHGTANGYKNYKCRCKPCQKAMRDYQRKYDPLAKQLRQN